MKTTAKSKALKIGDSVSHSYGKGKITHIKHHNKKLEGEADFPEQYPKYKVNGKYVNANSIK